jgi:uroporphyrinogen decarboxylase
MNSKERVRAALERRPVDRVPVFMWFHPDTSGRLGRLLEIAAADVPEAMGNDVRQAWVNNNYAMEGIVHDRDGEGHRDFWGIEWVRQHGFNQIAGFPLATATREQVFRYRFPADHLEELLQPMSKILGRGWEIARSGEYFVGCDVSPCAFEMYWRLRGMEQTFMDLATDRVLAREMLDRCAEFSVLLSETACGRFPLDWLWTGDDVAGQQGMMLSPSAWRELVKPALARVFDVGKARGLPVAYHCCGALRPIIPDLIEIGMDVLNPVQSNCPGMEPLDLKHEFGQRLAFMGGVDTQDLLSNGSVDEVRRATARLLDGMTAGGGGYILAASHTIPPETPDENIFAMYAEAGISREEIFDRASAIRKGYARATEGGLP